MPTVVRAQLSLVELPLVHEFRTSSHSKDTLAHILVVLTADDGRIGWGECASPAHPYFNEENVDTCWTMLERYFLPALLGRQWTDPEQAYAYGDRIRGNRFARAAVDIACWDLWARTTGGSVASALGASQQRIEVGVSLGIEPTLDDLLEQVADFLARGYRRVKLKIAQGWDVEPVAAVRERFGDIPLHVDANAGYPVNAESLGVLQELDRFGLLMIEQPFAADDLQAHAWAQRVLHTPICLDESITTPAVARTALDLDAARVVNIKVSRLGGIVPARQVHDLCRTHAVPVWCGGMHEFGVGRAANIAIAALPGFTLPSDISGSDKYFAQDLVRPVITATDGLVEVPYDRPGFGFDIDAELVADRTLRTVTIDEESR